MKAQTIALILILCTIGAGLFLGSIAKAKVSAALGAHLITTTQGE